MDRDEQMVADAKRIVIDMSLAHLGNVNAMAEEESLPLVEAILDDPNHVYVVMRMFALTVSGLATSSAALALGVEDDDDPKVLEVAARFIRSASSIEGRVVRDDDS